MVGESAKRGLTVNINKTFSTQIPKENLLLKRSIFINDNELHIWTVLLLAMGKVTTTLIVKANTVFGNMKNVPLSCKINLMTRLSVGSVVWT